MSPDAPPGCKDDPADLPRCEMEALADRMRSLALPSCVRRINCDRMYDSEVCYQIRGVFKSREQLDDLIAFLQEVRG